MKTAELYELFLKHPVICTDTRKITDSCLFFALKGESFDANEFAEKAIASGAAFAVIDNPALALDERYIRVDNVLETLQSLATFHRKQLKIPVIAITGSNGKTTTKELLKSVLSQQFNVFATEGNLNNHIGVPLTLLSISPAVELAIVEMGANHKEEIRFLCGIAQPDFGLITNIGKAHLEGFGGIEGVRSAKGELYEYLAASNGTVFINKDNAVLVDMADQRKVTKMVGYGRTDDNFVSGDLFQSIPTLTLSWQSRLQSLKGNSNKAVSQLPGIYNFENILAAICIGSYFELSPDQINRGINAYQPKNSRSQILKTNHNTVICDYYNANPSSMAVALDNLEASPGETKALILGDMFELGVAAAAEHRTILEKAMRSSAGRKIFIGKEFLGAQKGADAEFYNNTAAAMEALKKKPIKDSMILLKGSRGMQLETLLGLL